MKSLLWVCLALETRRAQRAGNDQCPSMSEAIVPEFWRLVDEENFVRLEEARKAVESGYSRFLSNLTLTVWWCYRESTDSGHVRDVREKDLIKIERDHQRDIRKTEKELSQFYTEEEFRVLQERWKEEDRLGKRLPRRTRNATDLPTCGMVEDIHRSIFSHESEFWKAHPHDSSQIWKDAGLAWLPQDRNGVGGKNHPNVKSRIASLKAYIQEVGLG